jgi:hypothetical protein
LGQGDIVVAEDRSGLGRVRGQRLYIKDRLFPPMRSPRRNAAAAGVGDSEELRDLVVEIQLTVRDCSH